MLQLLVQTRSGKTHVVHHNGSWDSFLFSYVMQNAIIGPGVLIERCEVESITAADPQAAVAAQMPQAQGSA